MKKKLFFGEFLVTVCTKDEEDYELDSFHVMVEKKWFFDEFLTTVCAKDGEDYELDSFRVMLGKKWFFDEFLATVRTKDGKDYELDSFRVMVERKLFSDEFLATVRTKDGKDYELDSFRVMVTTFDRCLTEKEYKRSIILEGSFKSWKQILEEKFQLLRQKLRQRQAAQLVSHDKIKTTIKEKRKREEKK